MIQKFMDLKQIPIFSEIPRTLKRQKSFNFEKFYVGELFMTGVGIVYDVVRYSPYYTSCLL